MLYFNQSESFLRTKAREEEESGLANEFSKGVSSGVDQLQGLIGGGGRALVGSLSGNDDLFYSGMNYYNEQMDEAAENAAEVGRIEDIDGVGDFLKYSAFVVGNILPSVVGTGGVGAAGGVLAKKAAMMTASRALVKQSANQLSKKQAGTLYSLSTVGREALAKRGLFGQKAGAFSFGAAAGAGESFTRILDETGEEAAYTALITGVISGGLDAMMPMQALKRILPQEQFRDAAAEVGEKIFQKKSVVGRALKEAGEAAGTEGITEMMQEIVQNASLETIRGMSDPSLEDSFVERMLEEGKRGQYLNAFVAGSIGGGFIGGVTGAVTKDPDDTPSVTRQKLLTADGQTQDQIAADENAQKVLDDDSGNVLEADRTDSTTQPEEAEQTDLTAQTAELEVDESDNSDPRLTDEGGTRVQQQRERMDQNEQFDRSQPVTRGKTAQQVTDNREQVQADIRADVTGIDTDAERVPTQGRQAAIEKAQGLPSQRPARDTAEAQQKARLAVQQQLASQADLRGSMKAILAGLEADALVRSDRQADESEVTQAAQQPTAPAVEPVEVESAAPETMNGLLGMEVDYQGAIGLLTRKAEGYYVSQNDEDILVESGESKSPAELGIAATDQSVVFENDIEFDAATKTFMLYGKKYKLKSFRRDSNGKPVSIIAENASGQIRRIRNPELASRLDLKVNPPDSIVQLQIPFTDLPVKVQENIFNDSKNSGIQIPDGVSYDAAIAASQGDPEVVQSVQNLARFQVREDTALDMTQNFTGEINRTEATTVTEAIDSYNQSIAGTGRSPLDEQQLNELLNFPDSPQKENMSGIEVLSANEFYAEENSLQRQELLLAMVDLVANGLPKSALNAISGLGIIVQGEHRTATDAPAGIYRISTKALYLDNRLLTYAVDDEGSARRLRFVIAHELGHAQDLAGGVTDSSASFSVELDSIDANQATLNLGDVVNELYVAFQANTDLGKEMTYPFNLVFEMVNRDASKVDHAVRVIKREAYAQAFAVFHSNPSLLQNEAPLAYNYFNQMLRTAEGIQNGESNIQTGAINTAPARVQGNVQPPSDAGGLQVQKQRGSGEDGGNRGVQGQASQELGVEAEPNDGDSAGRSVQLGRTEIAEEAEFDEGLQGLMDDDILYAPSSIERLQEVDSSYNQAKVRSLSQLQERIPLDDRISGEYVEGQPLTPVSGGKFSGLDLSNRGDGLDISQADLESILTEAVRLTDTNAKGQVGDLAKKTVERLGINANTVEFWDRALKLSDNARYWYEVSAEAMRDVMPDLSDTEIKQFISVVAATSPVANPFVNMHRAMASFANNLQGRPIDNDLVIQKGVTDALKTSDLEGLKTGSFGGTMQLVLGMAKPTLSTNDRQVAATFNTDGEAIGKNPELYEVMSRFYMGLRDKLNANLPEGAQPYETWQLQALGWVEQRYKNEFVKDKKAEGMSEDAALSLYQSASPEEISGGVNDVDDYSMSLLREDTSGRRDRKGAIQVLKEAGIAVPNNKITREILLDPRVPAALSPTTANFREKRTITAEINSLRNDTGKDARSIFDAAVEQGNQQIADEYHAVFATLLNKSSQGKTNPFTPYFRAMGLTDDAKPTRVATPTGGVPLAVGGTYEGDVSPNIRVPVPASITGDQLNVLMTSLSKQWDQDAVPASHVTDMADGIREGYTETSQVFVETLDALSRDQIEAFANALPEGVEVNFTRYPNGYEFNVLAFDQEGNPVTPAPDAVDLAAEQMLIADESSITNIYPKDAQWQPAGYSEIQNYDDVFASFKESLYTEQAQKLIGKVQRKQNGKVRDLTEKQIVAALRRKSPDNSFAGQGNARIQRAHGAIKQRLSDFQQAEGIAKSLAEARDTKLKLFIQKNSKKLGVPSQSDDLLFSPPSKPVGKPNANAIPEVNAAYKKFKAGEISQQDFDTVVLSTISEYDFVPTPATYDEMFGALNKNKKQKINVEIQDGEVVGLRLDIPAYTDHGVWVPTIHGDKTSHRATASITSVKFGDDKQPEKAQKVMEGGHKSPFAQMRGAFVNRTDAENEALAKEALNDPAWTQIGFDPRRHSYFYDRGTGQPILRADEVIQVGPLVLAKGADAEGKTSDDFLFSPPSPIYEEENAARYAAIREEKSAIDSSLSWIKTKFKRDLTSRGLLNEEVFQSMVSRDGEIGAADIDVRMLIRNYDEAIKNNFEAMTPEVEASLTAAMATPVGQIQSLSLPDDVKNSMGKMRQYIDKLSLDYSFILQDEITKLEANDQSAAAKSKVDLLKIIAGNTGKYVNRSFRVFDDPTWARSVPDEVLEAATNYLVEQGASNPDRIINTILKDGSGKAFAGISSFIRETTLGSKDLSIIKKKKNIAPEILALMGEYQDPRINFAKTATKLSRLVFNHRFLEEVRLKGEGVFLFTEDNAPTGSYVQLAADASDAMAPLNGLYTTPELKQGFVDATENDSLRGFFGLWQSLNSFVKYGKTVVAPTTIARNFMSASLFTVANGHFNWSEAGRSMESMVSYFNSQEGGPTAYLRELKRLGVMYDTPRGSELVKALEDSFGTGSIDREVSRDINLSVSGAKDFSVAGMDFFAKFYQFGDDFWKIIGFENQVTVFMNAKGMSREEAMPLAAERIRDTYPTYSLIGRSIKKLRTFPLVGTFVSFPAEIIRTTYNMLRYIRQDMADPEMRGHATQRIFGMSMVSAGIYAMQDAALKAWGVDEEEEEALRLMSPHWSENSNILPTGRDEKGNLEYIDLTYLDPYAYLKKPLNALLRDQPMDDAIVQAGRELLSPFFGVDIAAGAFLEVYQNEKVSGGRIFNPADSAENITAEIGSHFGKSLLPSILQNLQRTAKAINGDVSKSGKRYVLEDELLAWVGFRSTTFDPKIALHFKAYEFNEAKRDATSILTNTFRDPNAVDDADLADSFYTASAARKEGYERMIKLVSAARSSGLNDTQLMMILRSNGVTQKDARALVKGDIDSWSLSDSTLKNTLKKSDLLFGKEKSQQFEDRWKLITQLLQNEN